MSTLSDLLPAGSGGKNVDFVADGAINNAQTVALKTDGTVEPIVETSVPQQFGSDVIINGNNETSFITNIYDSNSNKVVTLYLNQDGSNDGTARVGTVNSSNNSISYGTAAEYTTNFNTFTSGTFCIDTNKVVYVYADGSSGNLGTAVVGTVSGTNISFGSTSLFYNGLVSHYTATTYDTNSNKVVIAYSAGNNGNRGTAIVGDVSGTSISFGSSVDFETGSTDWIASTFDSNENKVVISYRDNNNSYYGTAIVGTVSGNSISFGSSVVFNSATTEKQGATFDSNSNKVVLCYQDQGNSNRGTAIVGTISGTSISFGTAVVFETGESEEISAVFDTSANKVVVAYVDKGDNSGRGKVILGTVSGTSISFGTPLTFEAGQFTDNSGRGIALAYDVNANRSVVGWKANENNGEGTIAVFEAANVTSNNTSFIGITDAAISDTATGSVTIKGGIATTQLPLSAVYNNQNFSTASQDPLPEEVRFKPDGTKFYILGATNDAVYQYSMSTAWDVSTASYESKSFSVQTQDTNPQGLAINADGTSFYMCGQSMSIYQYDLTTAYDASTASYASKSFSFSGQISGGVPWGIDFDSTGTKLYVIGSPGTAYQYTLSTAFDVSTASYASKSLDTTSQTSDTVSLALSSDGASLYVMSNGNDTVFKYTLSTPNDLATASYSGFSFTTTSQDTTPYGVAVKTDDTQVYITGAQNDSVYQYSLSTSLTPNSVYYVQGDGTVSTTSTSPAVRIGKALSSTSINLEFNS